MIRILLEIALPLLLPTVAYLVWRNMRTPKKTEDGIEEDDVPAPWLWLAGTGVVLLLITLVATASMQGAPADSVYTPPYLKDGKVVPGQMK